MPEVNGKHYPYTKAGKAQAKAAKAAKQKEKSTAAHKKSPIRKLTKYLLCLQQPKELVMIIMIQVM